MIKQVIVTSRQQIEYWAKHQGTNMPRHALISIYGDEGPLSKENKKSLNYYDIDEFYFHDITKEENDIIIETEPGRYALFNEDQAKEIVHFIDRMILENVSTLVVHCNAGISRSGAVGLFACRYLKLDENKFRKDHPGIGPNFYMLELLNKVSGLRDDYVTFWKDLEEKRIQEARKNFEW